MPKTYLKAMLADAQTVNPLFNFLHARLRRAEDGEAEVILTISKSLTQGLGMVAGGILATLADEAMAHAAISTLAEDERCVTVEMNIRYLRAADAATVKTLTAKGSVLKRGKHIIVCTADVFDDTNRLLASTGSTFSVLPPQ